MNADKTSRTGVGPQFCNLDPFLLPPRPVALRFSKIGWQTNLTRVGILWFRNFKRRAGTMPLTPSLGNFFTDGRIVVRGNRTGRKKKKQADYLPGYIRDFPIAITEAKAGYKKPGDDRQQAKVYAEILGLLRDLAFNASGFTRRQRLGRRVAFIMAHNTKGRYACAVRIAEDNRNCVEKRSISEQKVCKMELKRRLMNFSKRM
jgi:hypothetical protein